VSRPENPGFKPVIGGLRALAISIGGIIGSGIFFIMGFSTDKAGPAVVISLVIAGAVALLTALSFASLGSLIPKEGGEYQFVYRAFGPTIGFLGGLFWIFSTAIAAVTVSLAFASYLSALLPLLDMRLTAAAACLLFITIDTLGIRTSSSINSILVVIKVSVLALFIIVGLSFVDLHNFNPLVTKGWSGVFSGAFLIFFAYSGFGKITAAAEEVKEPKKNVPRAIIYSVLISSVIYILVGFVAIGVVGAPNLASSSFRNAPLAYVMLSTGFSSAFFLVAFGAVAATSSVLMIQVLGMSRTIYGMSANGQLPDFFSKLHPRFRTPYRAELILGAFMAVAALVISVSSLAALTSLAILGYYAIINLSALRVRLVEGVGRGLSILLPILGFLSCASLIIYFLLTLL
jgi:APA family basic amino acid/polyamine antiporter